jgi:hypothetical protein
VEVQSWLEARRCIRSAQAWIWLAEELVEDQRILGKFWRERYVLRLGHARAELGPIWSDDGRLWDALPRQDRDHVSAMAVRLAELEALLQP